jgi:hypothetical protein
MMLSLTAFSQTATDTNSNVIPVKSFPIPIVKMIVKDLMAGDAAKISLKLTEDQLKETETKVALKDSIINTMKIKEVNFGKIIEAEREKFKIQEDYSKSLETALRKEKVKNKFTKIFSGGLLAVAGFLLIAH